MKKEAKEFDFKRAYIYNRIEKFVEEHGISNYAVYEDRIIGVTYKYTMKFIDLMLELEREYYISAKELVELFVYYLTIHGETDFEEEEKRM